MSTWHVWGDYVQTRPEKIGNAQLVAGEDKAAQATAKSHGFDFDYRLRNGFMPWAATFRSENDDGQEFAFAAYPIVRGWEKARST
jgi:hypothetical protein